MSAEDSEGLIDYWFDVRSSLEGRDPDSYVNIIVPVSALLALHDTLTDRAAADRYAANEERQREEAEPEWPEGWRDTAEPLDGTDEKEDS